MIRKFHYALLFLAMFGFSTPLLAQSSPNIAGAYWVLGTNPGNTGSYKGTATIAKEGDKYRVHWTVGTTYDGIGTLTGKTFKVEWGTATAHVGTVTYTLQPNGVMNGTWYTDKNPTVLGTEILTPKR